MYIPNPIKTLCTFPIPRGPSISTLDPVSFLLTLFLFFGVGGSTSRKDTSGGSVMGARPICEGLEEEHEKEQSGIKG